ncbi:MAG: hypothetical protein NTX25_12065 [Proteobacteria bacterium]|nr:hypothetical protein [Pseudomonadota bacterium]
MKIGLYIMLLSILGGGACTSNQSTFSDRVIVEPVGSEAELSKYVQTTGDQKVLSGKHIQWFACTKLASAPTLVMLSPDSKGFAKASFCSHPVALEGLEHDFNVLLINLPYEIEGKGQEAFGDNKSSQEILEFLAGQTKDGRQLEGLWGFGDGSVLALRLARQLPWKFLVIGNGIYDWEQTLKESLDPAFTARLQSASGEDKATFAEQHSAAWDLTGLPQRIFLYHGGKNTQVLPTQASQFKTSLAASEYQVELFLLEEDGNELRSDYHRGVMSKILQRYLNQP